MDYTARELIKKEIMLIIEENNYTNTWYKTCVDSEDKDKVLDKFVNKFYRSMRFGFEYDSEEECFNLIDGGTCFFNEELYYELTEFMDNLKNLVKKQLEDECKCGSPREAFKSHCKCNN